MSSRKRESICLHRDVFALMVPSGARVMLHQGTEVEVTQSLGSSYTLNVFGNLLRIDGVDADALGKEVISPLDDMPDNATLDEKVWAVLHTVFDPEIPVNIVDLGLVYRVDVTPDGDQYAVAMDMTLTAPACGMGPVLAGESKKRIEAIPEVKEAIVEIVFEPLWDQSMMSEVAKLQLGMF